MLAGIDFNRFFLKNSLETWMMFQTNPQYE